MVVAYATDKKLYYYLYPITSALIDKNPEVERIHIFQQEPLDAEEYKLTDSRIVIHPYSEVGEYISSLGPYSNYRFGMMTFARLCLPMILEEEKVLYLDVDAFVRKNLSEFWNTDFKENYVVGCAEPKKTFHNDPYLNAGVLLMNLEGIRTSGLWREWVEMMNHGKPLVDGDQDIIHRTCKGRKGTVPPTFNSNKYTQIVSNPHIEHGTPIKPWNPKFKYYREYLEYDNRRVK